jgi:hypothetical protein
MKRTMIQTLFENAAAFSGDPCAKSSVPVHAPVVPGSGVQTGVQARGKQAP